MSLTTSTEIDADRLVRAGDLVAAIDIARRLERTNYQSIYSLFTRYPEHAPRPVATVGQSKVYLWPEVREFWQWYTTTPHNYGGRRGGNTRGSGVGARRSRAKVKATPLDAICRMPGCNNVRWRNSPFCQADTYAIQGHSDDASE